MPETFLILLSGGVMLAVAIARPRDVTVQWLRLGGILALCFAGIAVFFALRRDIIPGESVAYIRIQRAMLAITIFAILGQLAFAQVLWLRTQRVLAAIAFMFAVMVGAGLIHPMVPAAFVVRKPLAVFLQTLGCAGVGATTGLALMDMLLGHAYLTAARMTISPFRRLNLALAGSLLARGAIGVVAIILQSSVFHVEMFWQRFGLYMMTRWLVGLIIPGVFVYMAHDCIKRRSTQSATGILYVAGVLIFIGELAALYLMRETGLPL